MKYYLIIMDYDIAVTEFFQECVKPLRCTDRCIGIP